ncbi:hypothetical protein KIPB_012635, partial [Kipferlia bialata]|eukprot:g12635.t1
MCSSLTAADEVVTHGHGVIRVPAGQERGSERDIRLFVSYTSSVLYIYHRTHYLHVPVDTLVPTRVVYSDALPTGLGRIHHFVLDDCCYLAVNHWVNGASDPALQTLCLPMSPDALATENRQSPCIERDSSLPPEWRRVQSPTPQLSESPVSPCVIGDTAYGISTTGRIVSFRASRGWTTHEAAIPHTLYYHNRRYRLMAVGHLMLISYPSCTQPYIH